MTSTASAVRPTRSSQGSADAGTSGTSSQCRDERDRKNGTVSSFRNWSKEGCVQWSRWGSFGAHASKKAHIGAAKATSLHKDAVLMTGPDWRARQKEHWAPKAASLELQQVHSSCEGILPVGLSWGLFYCTQVAMSRVLFCFVSTVPSSSLGLSSSPSSGRYHASMHAPFIEVTLPGSLSSSAAFSVLAIRPANAESSGAATQCVGTQIMVRPATF